MTTTPLFYTLGVWITITAAAGPAMAADAALAPPVTRTLDNGLRVAVFEDHRLPRVHMSLMLRDGVASEPAGAPGVANLTAQMLRLGTSSRDAATFSAALDQLGATFTAASGREHSAVSITALARDRDAALELLADAILRPRFPPEEFDGLQRHAINTLLRLRASPLVVAEDHLWRATFGDDPYGRAVLGTPGTLTSITVDQVRAFHRDHYRPRGATLMVYGDVVPDQVFDSVLRMLGEWSGAPLSATAAPPAPLRDVRVRIVDVPEAPRAELRVGMLGLTEADPQLGALQLAGEIAGGPLSGLGRALPQSGARTAVAALRRSGLVVGAANVPADSAASAIDRLFGAFTRLREAPPDAPTLERAKRRLRGSLPFQSESPADRMADWWAATERGGNAADPAARLAAVDAAAVHAVASRVLTPGASRIVAVGPAATLGPQLERFGAIEVVPLIEAPVAVVDVPDTMTLSAEQQARGRQIVQRMLRAHGGTTKLRGIKDSWIEGDLVMTGRGAEMTAKVEQMRKEPGKFVYVTRMLDFSSRQVLNGDSAWTTLGDTVQTHGAEEVALIRQAFASDLPHVLLVAADERHVAGWLRDDTIGDRRTQVVLVRVADQPAREYHVDAQNGQLLAIDERELGRAAVLGRREFRDYRPESGIAWAHEEERSISGERIMVMYTRKVRLNAGIGDGVFARPKAMPVAGPR